MAQRNLIFQPATQDNCYPQLPQVEPELGYSTFVSSDVNQVMPQIQNYPYEHVHRLQQPSLPYYAVDNPQPYCIPVQQTLRYQPSRLIQRKNRNVPSLYQYQDSKRLRIDGQPNQIQSYQPNINMRTQQQMYYQQMSQTSIAKYPLDTQSPTNSSPSRSPILNTSVSPSSTRDPFEDVKCFHHRHQPITPAPISQTCYRPSNLYGNLSPQSFAPLQVPAESTTSSPLQNERDEVGSTNDFVNTRQQPAELLETILIQDEDDVNTLESEIVIVSVKSPTVPPQEQTASPLISSPHTPTEEPEVTYQPYPQRGLPLQQPQLQQPQLQPAQLSAGFPVHNNILDQNHFFTQDYEYPPQYPANNVQGYFTTDQQYTIPMYPRPGTPTPFNARPQPFITRAPTRRMTRPYDYMYTYVPTISPNIRDYNPFEEQQGFILHPISHPHTPSRPKKQGLTKAELKKLKVVKYKLAESKDIDESCVICMDEYKDGDKLYVLGCNHEYHRDCVKDWLVKQRNCPLCRKEVTP